MGSPPFSVRRLVPGDARASIALRREALEREPTAFLSSPEDDRAISLAFVEESLANPAQATFGAFAPQLVGSVGVSREPKQKAAHKAHVWGMYVTASHRRSGIARALLTAAIGFARQLPGVSEVHLSVASSGRPAVRLYESIGFSTWGVEPRGMKIDGEFVALHHMLLELAGRG